MSVSERNLALFYDQCVHHYGMFEQMPEHLRQAVRIYCIEGVDDEDFPEHVAKYRFLYSEVPVERVKESIMCDKEIAERFKTFDEYHKWYCGNCQIPKHEGSRWPCIVSAFPEETFEDGWHRFHSYVQQGDDTIPILAFLDKQFEPHKESKKLIEWLKNILKKPYSRRI